MNTSSVDLKASEIREGTLTCIFIQIHLFWHLILENYNIQMKLILCIMLLSKCKAFYFSYVFVHVHNLCLMDKKILLFLMKKLATSYQHTFTIKHSVRSENTPRPPCICSLSDGLFNSTIVEYVVYVSAIKVFSYFWVNFINTSVSFQGLWAPH